MTTEYLYCGATLGGRTEPPYTCHRRIHHEGPCRPTHDPADAVAVGQTWDRIEEPGVSAVVTRVRTGADGDTRVAFDVHGRRRPNSQPDVTHGAAPLVVFTGTHRLRAAALRDHLSSAGDSPEITVTPDGEVTGVWLAEYEGTTPTVWTSEKAAIDFCDDFARAEARGRHWDWVPVPEEPGTLRQMWVADLDDRPTGETGGQVTPLGTEGAERGEGRG